MKFTPKGGTIALRAYRNGSDVCIRVANTGEGIRPDALPLIFDPFQQADASTTRRHGGLGLGLAIVKHIVDHEPALAHSRDQVPRPGEGAAARQVTLPKERPPSGQDRPAAVGLLGDPRLRQDLVPPLADEPADVGRTDEDTVLPERVGPRSRMLLVAVEEGPVDVEEDTARRLRVRPRAVAAVTEVVRGGHAGFQALAVPGAGAR